MVPKMAPRRAVARVPKIKGFRVPTGVPLRTQNPLRVPFKVPWFLKGLKGKGCYKCSCKGYGAAWKLFSQGSGSFEREFLYGLPSLISGLHYGLCASLANLGPWAVCMEYRALEGHSLNPQYHHSTIILSLPVCQTQTKTHTHTHTHLA